MIKRALWFLLALAVCVTPVLAVEIGGVSLPDELAAGGDQLLLNGAGLRKKFVIKVYAGGLYLPQKAGDPSKIIAADQPMAIRMHFIYKEVKGQKLIDTWNEGFAKAAGDRAAAIRPQIERFNSYFSGSAYKGDVYDLIYVPEDGVRVYIKGQLKGTVAGIDFKQALFAIWLGDRPADKGLKAGMLGGK